jgi:SPOR domain
MTTPKTSIQSVNLDDLEREMRRIAVSRRSVGRGTLTRTGVRPVLVTPFHLHRDNDEPPTETELGSDAIPQRLERGTESAAVPHHPAKRRSPLSSRALALVVICLLMTGAVVAMIMRAGPKTGSGTRAPTMGEDQASSQHVAHPAAQMPSPGDGSSTNPLQPLDVAASTKPAETTMPAVAADVPLPNPPERSAVVSTLGTPHDLATEAIKPDAAIVPQSEPEVAPLPPSRPRGLASARATAARAAKTGNVTPAPSKEAVKTVAKQSNASANGAGIPSFSIQLASSLSESEARDTLSRLKKQFPDALRGGSVRTAQGSGTGAYYRVEAGPLSRDAAENACSRLRADDENCIVVRR